MTTASATQRRYRIRHDTHYRYEGAVARSMQWLHLQPRECPWQTCIEHSLQLDPDALSRQESVDAFGNPTLLVDFIRVQNELTVSSNLLVDVRARPANVPGDSLHCADVAAAFAYAARRRDDGFIEASRFLYPSPHIPRDPMFHDWAAPALFPHRPVREAAERLMQHIHAEFEYLPGSTDLTTSTRKVLEQRRGVCQDFAHVMIAGLRAHGIPARYVSGYIRTGNTGGDDALVGADATHAWVSVWCPPLGWIDFDPTNNTTLATDHITIAWGRDFSDVSPLRGILIGGGEHQLEVAVTVQPVDD